MDSSNNLDLPYILPSQAQKHVTHNEAIGILDAIVQLCVLDRDLSTPPGSPAAGSRYIVAAGATGDWAGQTGKIAHRLDGAWVFHAPQPGFIGFVADEQSFAYWTGAAWVALATVIGALQNLTLLGIGTTADAANPFSAKLNKALWTAKTAAEGGDGDLRYTLNKETAADVVSFLLQRAFSGRAEFGLIGDDDLTVKVSPNGSSWTTALTVDKTSGLATVVANPTAALGVATKQYAVARAGDTMTGGLTLAPGVAGTSITVAMETEGAAAPTFQQTVYRDAQAGANFGISRHARGTKASPTVLANADRVLDLRSDGYDGTAFQSLAYLQVVMSATTPSTSNMAAKWVFRACPTTAGSITSTTGELLSLEHATGLSMFGANVVIDEKRHHRLRSYTVATLPTASPAGQMIYVSDGTSNKRLAVSDATNWRWPDGAVVS